jgi:hypothetical protein
MSALKLVQDIIAEFNRIEGAWPREVPRPRWRVTFDDGHVAEVHRVRQEHAEARAVALVVMLDRPQFPLPWEGPWGQTLGDRYMRRIVETVRVG